MSEDNMCGNWKRVARIVGLGGALLAMAGCAATDSIPYPKLSSVKRITKRVLTREEKEEAIRDLSEEQQRHRDAAERELEKR